MMTTGTEARTDQKGTIEKLLNDEQVLVHINPQCQGVHIPNHLFDNRTVTLRLSRFFKGALSTDTEKISAELLFGQDYFSCVIPWNSIWGASSIRGEEFIWAEAAPDEILEMVLAHKEERQAASKQVGESSYRTARSSRPNPGHLRRVK